MYFKTTAMEDRHEVSDYYRKIANVARIGAMGNIRFYCDSKNDLDPNNSGQGDMCMKNRTRNNKVAAYSRSGLDRIVMVGDDFHESSGL